MNSAGVFFPGSEPPFMNPTDFSLQNEPTDSVFNMNSYSINNGSSSSLSTTSPVGPVQSQNELNITPNDTKMTEDWSEWQDCNNTEAGVAENGTSKPKKTRRRKPVNCSFCRRRKLKCDRKHPCSNCIKRNIESSCTYATEPNGASGPKERASVKAENSPNSNSSAPLRTSPSSSASSAPPSANLPFGDNTLDGNLNSKSDSGNYPGSINAPSSVSTEFSSPNSPSSAGSSNGLQQPRLVSRKARPTHQTNKLRFSDFPVLEETPDQALDLKKQLDKMEMLVLSMLQDKSSSDETYSSNSSPDTLDDKSITSPLGLPIYKDESINSRTSKARESLGMLKLDKSGKSIYHGDTHWASLFTEMQQLEFLVKKLQISKNMAKSNNMCEFFKADEANEESGPGAFFIPGGSKMSPMDVLNTIPSRSICDLLIARYFEFCEPCFRIVHQPVFLQEYNEFWECSTGAELVWVSLFLNMLTLALQSYLPENLPAIFRGDARKTWKIWLEGSEVCAYLGKMTLKPGLNNVRSMLIWILVQAEVCSKGHWLEQASLTISMTVRMCQSMGLHRDPKWFDISPYEAEERRRIWFVVQYFDTYCSMTQGLPSLIRATGVDVNLPTNINENDIMPSYEHEPMPTPLTTRTTSSFTIYRARMMRWLSQVLDVSSVVGPQAVKISYESVLEMHGSIQRSFNETPLYLSKSVLDSAGESLPPDQLMERLWYEIDYLRTILVLHRYFAALGMDDEKYRRSREETLAASFRMLQLQEWLIKAPESKRVRDIFSWFHWFFLTPYFLHASLYNCVALIDHYDTFTSQQQVKQIHLVEIALSNFQENKQVAKNCSRLTFMLEAMVSRVREISQMTKQERAELKQQKMQREQVHTFNIRLPRFNLGMAVERETNPREPSKLDFQTPDATMSQDFPVGVFSPSAALWDPFAEEKSAALDSSRNDALDISMAQFDSYYMTPQFQVADGWQQFN